MENIRKRAARALGWERCVAVKDKNGKPTEWYWRGAFGGVMYQPDYTFDPEHRHDHAAMLEAEVERRGLQGRYVSRLMSVVDRDTNEAYLFDYITATPAQRTEAAVLTIEAVERKES